MEYDFLLRPFLALVSSVLVYLAYRAALPRPIPGIPHHVSAANSILGDIPSMVRYFTSTKEVVAWFNLQCLQLDSPIVQLFIRPFGRPMVFIADWRESQDILTRRMEFDRSDFFGDVLLGLLPKAFICMPTNDTFRHQRRLLANTMSPAFLDQVAAPKIYNAALDLIELWRLKIKLVGNHPFLASSDIHLMALDAIWGTTFGTSSGATKSQVALLSSLAKLEGLSHDENVLAEFPNGPTPRAFDATVTMTDSAEKSAGSPVPRWRHWVIRQTPSYRNAKKYKDDLFDAHFRNASKRYFDDPDDQKDARCALESVVQREAIAASKEGRAPQFDSPSAKDDLFTFFVAGHDTTSTTVAWGVKYLTDNPQVQQKLRTILRTEFADAAAARTDPCADDIVKREIPYLDAVIEEILRCCQSSGAIRIAKVDAEVLGYRIPAGTDVYMLANGPSFLSPGFEVEESRRSPSSQANKDNSGGVWDNADVGTFNPERWLTHDEKGADVYNARAGPHLAFGLGLRGCFGKKLAYNELRIMIVLVVWEFELKKTPPELSGYEAVDKLTHRPQHCFLRLGLVH